LTFDDKDFCLVDKCVEAENANKSICTKCQNDIANNSNKYHVLSFELTCREFDYNVMKSFIRCQTLKEGNNSCQTCLGEDVVLNNHCVIPNCVEASGLDKSVCTQCDIGYALHEVDQVCVDVRGEDNDELRHCELLTDGSDVEDVASSSCKLCRVEHGMYVDDGRHLCKHDKILNCDVEEYEANDLEFNVCRTCDLPPAHRIKIESPLKTVCSFKPSNDPFWAECEYVEEHEGDHCILCSEETSPDFGLFIDTSDNDFVKCAQVDKCENARRDFESDFGSDSGNYRNWVQCQEDECSVNFENSENPAHLNKCKLMHCLYDDGDDVEFYHFTGER
jgi:hypothetical protein